MKCFKEVWQPCIVPLPSHQYNLFVWIPDSGSIFKVRSHNCLVKNSKAGVIQSTKLSSDYSKESIGFVYAHINMVPKDSLVSKTTPRSISSVQQRIGVLLVLELWFLGNNHHCHDYMLLI